MRGGTAVYIAGDERIMFPALVCIASIQEHNPGAFDFFIYTWMAKADEGLLNQARAAGVKLFDLSVFESYRVPDMFVSLGGRWPIEIFYNWLAPHHLHELGYEFSIKCDYDILCVGRYEPVRKLLPEGKAVAGDIQGIDPFADVPADELDTIEALGLGSRRHKSYMNVGFLVFDNALYLSGRYFDRFRDMYVRLTATGKKYETTEQVAFAIILSADPGKVHRLPIDYNQRIRYAPRLDGDGALKTKNIHYMTFCKPWRNVSRGDLEPFFAADQGAIVPYILYWRAIASRMEAYDKHVAAPRFDALDALRFSMLMVDGYNAKSRAAKKDFDLLKREHDSLKARYDRERSDALKYRRILSHPVVKTARKIGGFIAGKNPVADFLQRVRWSKGV